MTYTHTHRLLAATVTLSAALTVGAFAPAAATRIVGLPTSTTGQQAPAMANTIVITLSKGNPDPLAPELQGEIAGVTVVLSPLAGIDSTNQADVDKVKKASLQDIVESWPKGTPLTAVTSATGRAGFFDVPNGIYVVTSISPNDGNRYRSIEPFLVSMPHAIAEESAPGNEAVLVAKTYLDSPPDDFDRTPTPSPTPSRPDRPPVIPHFPPDDTPGKASTPTPGAAITTPAPPADATATPPVAPGATPTAPVKKGPVPGLAMTGAQVIGVVVGALALIVSGFLLLLASRKRREEKSA